jgi:acyl-CoA synthetase (NDP forming)
MNLLAADPAYDSVMVMIDAPKDDSQPSSRQAEMLRAVDEAVAEVEAYGVFVGPTVSELKGPGLELVGQGLHFGNGLPLTLFSLGRAGRYPLTRERILGAVGPTATLDPPELPATRRSTLTELEALALLDDAGIPTVARELATSPETAAAAAERIGFPVVLKVQSPDVPHKSDVGGVALGVTDGAAASAAYDTILADVTRNVPGATIDGVLVARQVSPVVELLLGVTRDVQFGPVVTVAAGGRLAELLDDAVSRVAPLSVVDVEDMLSELVVSKLLRGHRDTPAGDVRALVEAVVRLGALAAVLPDAVEALDVNPLFVLAAGEGVVAGDALGALRGGA